MKYGKEWVQKFCSQFAQREFRECPECKECTNDDIPKYYSSIGSLQQHLLEHYRVKYYIDNYKTKKKGRYIPWSDDYEETNERQLEKYMDRDIFSGLSYEI